MCRRVGNNQENDNNDDENNTLMTEDNTVMYLERSVPWGTAGHHYQDTGTTADDSMADETHHHVSASIPQSLAHQLFSSVQHIYIPLLLWQIDMHSALYVCNLFAHIQSISPYETDGRLFASNVSAKFKVTWHRNYIKFRYCAPV